MRHSLFVRSLVVLGALGLMGGFVYWRAFAARPMPGPSSQPQAAPTSGPQFDPLLMPGSKSAILVEPTSGGYPGAEVFSTTNTPIPADVVLPGSPANAFPPPVSSPVDQPVNPPPTVRREFLPGSKSKILPELLSTPAAAQRLQQQVEQQPRAANPPAQPPARQSSR